MKLMGTLKLNQLAKTGPDGVSSAVAPLRAELEVATWRSPGDVAHHYPTALVEGCSVRITLGDGYCVDLIAHYELGMIYIDHAGVAENLAAVRKSEGGTSA